MCVHCASRPATLHTAGTLLLAVMPRFGCPFCWPVLAAALSLCGLPLAALNTVCIALAAVSLVAACTFAALRRDATLILLALNASVLLCFRLQLLPAAVAYAAAAILLAVFLGCRALYRPTSVPHPLAVRQTS